MSLQIVLNLLLIGQTTTGQATVTTYRYEPQPPLVQTRTVEVQEVVPQPPRVITEITTVPTVVSVPAILAAPVAAVPASPVYVAPSRWSYYGGWGPAPSLGVLPWGGRVHYSQKLRIR